MITLSVGSPYPLPCPTVEGASANFLSKNGNTLQVLLAGISKPELISFRKGKIKAGFLFENSDLLWLFKFYDKKGRPVLTMDAHFDVRIIPKDILALHDVTTGQERLLIDIHVIDETATLRALRAVTMPKDLTLSFLSSAQDQITAPKSGLSTKKWMGFSTDQLAQGVTFYELGN